MFSPKVYFLEMEMFRLEQSHQTCTDEVARQSLVEQLLMNCDTLAELEAAGKGSKKIKSAEWIARYAPGRAHTQITGGEITDLPAAELDRQIEAIAQEPFDPARYVDKKTRIESLVGTIVQQREKDTSPRLRDVLSRLWEIAVREDDAHDNYERLARRS